MRSIVSLVIATFSRNFWSVESSMIIPENVIRINQRVWRNAAKQHQEKIQSLLKPGLTSLDDPLNSGTRKVCKKQGSNGLATALDPKNPIYNFLIEYYGLKGSKGTRRLSRWSPSPGLLLQSNTRIIDSLEELENLSLLYSQEKITTQPMENGGILLEGASEDDFGSTIHLRGASFVESEGILYSPAQFYGKGDPFRKDDNVRLSSPFLWYRSILEQTLEAEAILHCYGLHEWAMQYQPAGAPPPPSAKYQAHLPLRVSRDLINETVERKGVSCTHVDALRFFAQDALPLNKYGGPLSRDYQVQLEQPACVHAHMDLLKVALKLSPFGDSTTLCNVLNAALQARKLDVAASPYDASSYGLRAIAIETPEGRTEYRTKQLLLKKEVEPIRRDLLNSYINFLTLAFDDGILKNASNRLPSTSKQTPIEKQVTHR